MMIIPCPWCGPRNQTEFTYEGDATVERPDPETATDEDWSDHIFIRDNPRGPHDELWHHAAGCRRFIKVRRDTLTHEVLGSAPPDGEIPAEGGE